jgi:ferric-dicitrate binding protein FerR (iron transport regulator)
MEEEKLWYLLSVKLTGEATSEELATLDKLLQQNPEHGLQAQLLLEMWKKKPVQENKTDDFFNRHLQRFSNNPDIYPGPAEYAPGLTIPPVEKNNRRIARWLLPASTVAASVIVAALFFYKTGNSSLQPVKKIEGIAKNTVSTRKGSKSNIQLPDGTMAWLNADSKLTYDESFRGEFREVSLEGEAFFDVVKDKTRPFIIHTRTLDIKVLGTAFNVRAYESEKSTQTSLFRGSVEVSLHNNPEKKIVLKPNEKLVVNNKSLQFNTDKDNKNNTPGTAELDIKVAKVHFESKDSSALETLWIKNKLVFDAESLEEVAQKIERWYDVKVVINGDNDLKKTAYSGIFDNETLSQLMEALTITGNFKYTIHKNIVTIRQAD